MTAEQQGSDESGGGLDAWSALREKRCVFCPIIEGDAPATIIERGTDHIAFVPMGPHVPGHVLFVPTEHLPDATTNSARAGAVVAEAARYLAERGIEANIITSIGPAATQSVPHLHVHVIPRGADDGLPARWPWLPDPSAKAALATARREVEAVRAQADQLAEVTEHLEARNRAARRREVEEMRAERDGLMRDTFAAYVESGADTDGDEKWHCTPEWAGKALMDAVRTLRKDYDDSLDESTAAEAEREDFRAQLGAVEAAVMSTSSCGGYGADSDGCYVQDAVKAVRASLANPSAARGEGEVGK